MTITALSPLSPPWEIAVTNRGPAGVGATITVDPIAEDVGPDEAPGVVVTGTPNAVHLKFQLKQGTQGDVGPAPVLTAGDVTTVPNGNAAGAQITGADGVYELDLTIPEGQTGDPGQSSYTYIRYAADAAGADFSASPSETRDYVAIKTTTMPIAAPVAGDFVGLWKLYRGPLGPVGPMDPAIYDPTNLAADAFAMDNMAEGADAKIMTAAERAKLAGIENSADVTDSANVAAAGAFMAENVIDEDNMASNSDTKVPTQQSVKAYVDANTAGTSQTISAVGKSAVDIINIERDSINLVFEGVSHNDGTNRILELYYSTNNGASWTLWGNISGATPSSGLAYGGPHITGLTTGHLVMTGPVVVAGLGSNPIATGAQSMAGTLVASGPVNALRAAWATGVPFDAGNVHVQIKP